MKKAALSLALVVVLALGCLWSPGLAATGMDNFQQNQPEQAFTDIDGHWAAETIRAATAYGLARGYDDGSFRPEGEVTVAEAVTFAVRVHRTYRGLDAELPAGDPWYTPYVAYAEENGMLEELWGYVDYEEAASRQDVAVIFAAALPASELEAINDVDFAPFYGGGAGSVGYMRGGQSILRLYRAGVLRGSDAYGSFCGDENVTRAEAVAMLCRLAAPEMRLTFTLTETTAYTALVNGYWRNYGVTIGTSAVYDFAPDGTFTARYVNAGTITGTYTLSPEGVLHITGDLYCFGRQCNDLQYDSASGIFGKDMQIVIQGVLMQEDALSPISPQEFTSWGRW